MKTTITLILLSIFTVCAMGQTFDSDQFETDKGLLEISFIGHGTLMMTYNDLVIHIDPTAIYTGYSKMPAADLILITHEHGDHFNKKAIDMIKKEGSVILLTETCENKLGMGEIMKNGDSKLISGIRIDAVPAYNIKKAYHPQGSGNGYVLQFDDLKVYVAGDTENIPEMAQLKDIDIAFLPMNLPYTMTPGQVAEAARVIKPKILYPYHFGKSNTDELVELLKNEDDIDVRSRKLN